MHTFFGFVLMSILHVGSKRLRGRTLGIIGLGRIGKAMVVRAKVTFVNSFISVINTYNN